MDNIEQLKTLIETVGLTHYGKSLRSKYIHLYNWIMEVTSEYPENMVLGERVFIVLNGPEKSICEYGAKKLFNTLNKGYRFCSNKCRCRVEEQSRKITKNQNNLTAEEKENRIAAQKATLIEKYGVENAMHIKGVQEKIAATNMERYGFESAAKADIIKDKAAQTNIERYGTHSSSTVEVKEKAKKTNLQRYGTENTMAIAREAYYAQTGVANPFLLPEMQEKARLSMLKNHGVEHALQSPEIYAAMEEKNFSKYGVKHVMHHPDTVATLEKTMMDKYGFKNHMQNPEFIKKFNNIIMEKHNRENISQIRMSDETLRILKNEEEFSDIMTKNSVLETSVILDVSYTTILNYCGIYNIDVTSSSYETAIIAFLKENSIKYTLHDRNIIKPSEIDIVLPDYKIGIEFCGLYWHSEDPLTRRNQDAKKYHLSKLKRANSAGYRLITIFEDEWINNRSVVEKHLLRIVGMSDNGKDSELLEIKKIEAEQSFSFLELNHIQGYEPNSLISYGAYDDDKLVSVMSFLMNNDEYELTRFATDGKNYPGISNKLFETFIEDYNPEEVVGYADRRWAEQNLYKNLGFSYIKDTEPHCWYINYTKISRQNKSENEIMNDMNFHKIWDCGYTKFNYKK